HGISHAVAVAIFSVLGVGSIAGRLAGGGLADRLGRGLSLATATLGISPILMWWLLADSIWQLTLFALIFGSCWGSFVTLYPSLTVDYFGGRNASGIIRILYSWGHRHARRAEARRRWFRPLPQLLTADPCQRRL